MDPDALYASVRDQLAAHADADKAVAMQRYMKTDMPFFGVQRPLIRPIERAALRAHVPEGREQWEAGVRRLWSGPQRELKYVALAYLKGFAAEPKRRSPSTGRSGDPSERRGQSGSRQSVKGFKRKGFLDPSAVPLLEYLVRDGAWWDLVDDIAANAVGVVVANHREAMTPVLHRWITDDDLWIRRTAILAQLKHKDKTDTSLLFSFCLAQAHDTSFWIRKAIGWSLRQYARTDPDAVRAFLKEHGGVLSNLSKREAAKHL